MKPRIDISAKQKFTIWESGNWNARERIGRSTLVCGPKGEKMQVIFDTNPAQYVFQYLFFADLDQVVVSVFIRSRAKDTYYYDIDLSKITSLTTQQIQGHAVARASMESLFKLKKTGEPDFEAMLNASYSEDRIGYNTAYRDLMREAIAKALTPPEGQRLFWGTPREVHTEH